MTAHRVAVLPRNRGEILVRRQSREKPDPQLTPLTASLDDDPTAVARQCLHAEAGIPDAVMDVARVGEPVEGDADRDDTDRDEADTGRRIHPVLVDVETCDGTDASMWEWIAPPSLRSRSAVPWLWAAYDAVRPTVETVTADTTYGSTTLSVRALEVLRDEAALASDASRGDADAADGEQAEATAAERVRAVAREVRAARPAMTAVTNRVNRTVAAAEDASDGFAAAVADAAHEGIERASEADETAAANAADALPGDRIATLSRSGTVLAAIKVAAPAAVLVAESRPGGEGVGVAEALADGVDVTLTTDAAFPAELARWDADALLVGADTVLPDGSVRNKAGTYPAAAVAAREGIPMLVVTATDKISPDADVEREAWPGDPLYEDEAAVDVANPTFDVTPAACVDALVTEQGVLDPGDVAAIGADHRARAAWTNE
jgi:translation initiation factor 2B subunit (eIF-2B alpha/beta/delta family)